MQIVSKEILASVADTKITKIEVLSPLIAGSAQPGQFVVLMVDEIGERIPLTVVGKDKKKGHLILIFQELGFSTKLLGKLNPGDSLFSLTGPLGHATEIKNYGKVILVGGGVGIAEIYPVAKGLKEAGNQIITILGARSKELLILEDELREISDALHIATDDGSYGKKGFTTDILKELLSEARGPRPYALVYSVGPIPMMEKVALITKDQNIKTIASLNALMVDGTGMCGCCRVTVSGATKFSCIDGPEFDAHLVDWDGLKKRSLMYKSQEEHICKLNQL